MKEILTLIGKRQARLGYKFRYLGPCDEFENCNKNLRNICIGKLVKNHVYEIIEVRDIQHQCNFHKDGVVIVKVRELPIEANIESKYAFEGSIINYKTINCDKKDCKLFKYCVPIEFEKNINYKCRILRIIKKFKNPCDKFRDLTLAELEKI